jgi:hypothetical protein
MQLILFFLLLSLVPVAPALGAEPTPAEDLQIVILDSIKDCFRQGRQSALCLDLLFRELLAERSAAEVLGIIQLGQDRDSDVRLACHPIVHAIGRELFQRAGTIHVAFQSCNQTCHSGCYHGVVERFLWGGTSATGAPPHVTGAMLQEKAARACQSDAAAHLRFQCLHGLGHAILHFSGYQLSAALELCNELPDVWSQRSCYGGVFMENVTAATPEKRFVSATDYHHPCSAVTQVYRSDCYLMQTSRMIEMGLPFEALFAECAGAGSFRGECAQSIGRDVSNEARIYGPRQAASKCELAAGADREACIRGVVYALVDNTWDGSYALPFCGALADHADISYCFRSATRYMTQIFAQSAAQIARDCAIYVDDPVLCTASLPR